MTTNQASSDGEPSKPSGRAAESKPSSGPVSTIVCPNCGARNTIRPSPRGAPHCGTCGKPLPWVVDATDATFDIEAQTTATVLVDLWAPWCGPCRFVSPILGQLAGEFPGRLKVIKVNVDDNRALSQRFEALSIPTMVVMKDARVVDRVVGAMPKPALTARLTPYLVRRS